MDLKRIYLDSNDQKCNILEMVKREPEWAANRLQAGEKAIDDFETLREEMKAIALALGRSKTDGESDCVWHDLAGDVAELRGAIGPNLERARLQGRGQGIQVALTIIEKHLAPSTAAIIRRFLLESV